MGLEPDHENGKAWGLLRHRNWLLPLLLIGLAAFAESGGESVRLLLRYARSDIENGQFWRLLSGHLVHLGWSHLLMNSLALLGIWLLVGRNLRTMEWLVAFGVIIAGMDAGFWWLDPQLVWYVGLSGLLHGLLVAGLLAGWRDRPVESLVLGGLLIAKLVYEQWLGPLPGSAESAGGDVVVNSHLYGALAGVVAAVILRVRVSLAAPI
ncbi:MAG: rhombosortase [Woeseia sp.]|nr:rhombosortase [Woeseia sp.]